MSQKINLNPQVLAQRHSGFKFPPRMAFSRDLATSEMRLVILGWLKHAQEIVAQDGGIQELRDVIFRLDDLIIGLSAHEIQAHANSKEVKDATAPDKRAKPRKRKASVVSSQKAGKADAPAHARSEEGLQ